MPQRIHLIVDYGIEPIFLDAEDFDDTDYLEAADFSLSTELIQAIEAWKQELDNSLDRSIGRNRMSDQQWDDFLGRGLELARHLQSELGSEYEVYYQKQPVVDPRLPRSMAQPILL